MSVMCVGLGRQMNTEHTLGRLRRWADNIKMNISETL
jgi:hypothetical protein